MTTTALPSAAEPAHLTGALRASGVLGTGSVRDVTVLSARDTVLSHIIRLGLGYDGETSDAPRSLILKVAHKNFATTLWQAGRQEVSFYRNVARLMPPKLVPRCIEASWDDESRAWHLLLEDLTDTHHTATIWPLPPSLPQAYAAIGALGQFHAAWWNDPRLGHSIGGFASREDTTKRVELFVGHYQRFADYMGDRLSAERRAVYDHFIAAAPRLLERYHSREHLSIAHGDAHVWNFLLPKAAGSDDVRAFDFDQWHINVPAQDLAYMIALHLYPERRRAVERLLLDRYHAGLVQHGVVGYDRTALDHDYRWAVLQHLAEPVWQWARTIPPVIWWNNLERIFLAFEDLGCRDLLD